MFGALIRGAMAVARPAAGALLKAGRVANSIPVVGKALPVLGALGTAASVASILSPPRGGGGLPALPGMPGGVPATMGQRGIFANDPNIAAQLQNFAISQANLRTYFRAPKGFVVLRDEKGDAYGLPKFLARKLGLWKPARKPPISAGDWSKYQTAQRVEKKLLKLARKELRGRHRMPPRNIIIEKPGQKVIGRKVA